MIFKRFGLACGLFVLLGIRNQAVIGIRLKFRNAHSVHPIIKSAFNRDSFLQDFHIGPNEFSSVELLTTNTYNGIKLLVRDQTNFERYLKTPETIEDLIPALVCDYVLFCFSYGDTAAFLMKWREAYVRQHPGACLLVFQNDASGIRGVKEAPHPLKLFNHLQLIKAISDGRIITTTKYNELLESGLMTTPNSGRPVLKNDENSVRKFIKLLTPHMYSGIGIPSDVDMTPYPTLFYLDQDTLFTKKSTIPSFLQRLDEGLKLQPIFPSSESETLSSDMKLAAPHSTEDVDFVIATDRGCWFDMQNSVNAGVHLSRPTDIVATLLRNALHNQAPVPGTYGDQGAWIRELQLMSEFSASQLVKERRGGVARWTRPEHKNRIVFTSAFRKDSADSKDQALTKAVAQLNQRRIENMESFWGSPLESQRGSRVPSLVVVNNRWMNSMYLHSPHEDGDWQPGDWINHFTGFEREYVCGRSMRKWVCDNLDSVAHPDDWPSDELNPLSMS